MSIIDKNKYHEFSNVLSGCRTVLDAYHFSDKYSKNNPEMKCLLTSMMNGKRYDQVLDFNTMRYLMETLDGEQYKDDVDEIIKQYSLKTNDSTQLKTFTRISKSKILKPVNKINSESSIFFTEFKNMITQKCPHCERKCTIDINTTYVICGYINNRTGYDWEGCGKDWCFKCGKMLCKSWKDNELFSEINRFHDNECCKKHAKENSRQYPEEYCQCSTNNVIR